VYQLHKAEAITEMENLSGAKAGSKAALGQYQKALKYVIDGLSRRQVAEAEAEMTKWNKDTPPRHLQAK
jgi:anion-transporting  ArsA/GET3 family ATPase